MMFRFQVDVGNTNRVRQEVSRMFGLVEVSVGYAQGNDQCLWKKFGMVTDIREQQLNYTIAKSELCLLTDALHPTTGRWRQADRPKFESSAE